MKALWVSVLVLLLLPGTVLAHSLGDEWRAVQDVLSVPDSFVSAQNLLFPAMEGTPATMGAGVRFLHVSPTTFLSYRSHPAIMMDHIQARLKLLSKGSTHRAWSLLRGSGLVAMVIWSP